jgi:hypothetical protein
MFFLLNCRRRWPMAELGGQSTTGRARQHGDGRRSANLVGKLRFAEIAEPRPDVVHPLKASKNVLGCIAFA